MALTKKQRAELRMKFGGRCAYCGCELPEKGWHADHVEAALRKLEFGERQSNGTRRAVATGEFWRPENDAIEIFSRLAHRATCLKPHSAWTYSGKKLRGRQNVLAHIASTSALLNDLAWLKLSKSRLCSGLKNIKKERQHDN